MQGAGSGLYCARASRSRADDPAQDARGGRPTTTASEVGAAAAFPRPTSPPSSTFSALASASLPPSPASNQHRGCE